MTSYVTLPDPPEHPPENRAAPVAVATIGDLRRMSEALAPSLAPSLRHDLDGADIALVRVGATMTLPPGVALLWARFTATIRSDAGDPVISDVLPSVVATPDSAVAPVEVDDDGRLHRELSEGDLRPGFWEYVVGFAASPRTACWDFLPRNGGFPPAASRLLLGVRDVGEGDVFVSRRFHVRIHHPSRGEIGLTLFDEVMDWPTR